MKLAVLFIIILIAGLGSEAAMAAPPKTITSADSKHPITLQISRKLLVKLESNRSTGYSWFLAESIDPVLITLGKPTYQAGRALMGAGGIETWRFRAVKAGNETLKLEYRRPWEKNVPPAKTMLFDIMVRENAT